MVDVNVVYRDMSPGVAAYAYKSRVIASAPIWLIDHFKALDCDVSQVVAVKIKFAKLFIDLSPNGSPSHGPSYCMYPPGQDGQERYPAQAELHSYNSKPRPQTTRIPKGEAQIAIKSEWT